MFSKIYSGEHKHSGSESQQNQITGKFKYNVVTIGVVALSKCLKKNTFWSSSDSWLVELHNL